MSEGQDSTPKEYLSNPALLLLGRLEQTVTKENEELKTGLKELQGTVERMGKEIVRLQERSKHLEASIEKRVDSQAESIEAHGEDIGKLKDRLTWFTGLAAGAGAVIGFTMDAIKDWFNSGGGTA